MLLRCSLVLSPKGTVERHDIHALLFDDFIDIFSYNVSTMAYLLVVATLDYVLQIKTFHALGGDD